MGMFVRLADDFGGAVSPFQKSFFRNIVAVAVAGVLFLRACGRAAARPSRSERGRVALPRDRTGWAALVWRSIFGTIGIFGNFYALSHIPLGDACMLKGSWEEAAQAYENAGNVSGVHRARYSQGEELEKAGDMEGAAAAFAGVLTGALAF